VQVHDFIDPELGKAIPYGIYDISRDEGWVTVGIDHDTAQFAVSSITQWWKAMGRKSRARTFSPERVLVAAIRFTTV
jgi:Rhodopirellula transposase DDE domain